MFLLSWIWSHQYQEDLKINKQLIRAVKNSVSAGQTHIADEVQKTGKPKTAYSETDAQLTSCLKSVSLIF